MTSMHSFKKSLLTALVAFNGLVSSFVLAKENSSFQLLESKLELLKLEDKDRLHRLFDLYWNWQMEEFPEKATYWGFPGKHGCWTEHTEEAIRRRYYYNDQFLQILSIIQPAIFDDEDQISYDILKKILEDEQIDFGFGSQYLLVNQKNGNHLYPANIVNIMPAKTIDDYQNILSRLEGIPKFFEQTIHMLQQGLAAGITPPRIAINKVPQQILNQMFENPLESSFLKAFLQFPTTINCQDQSSLLEKAKGIYQNAIFPALENLYSFLLKEYLPKCRSSIAFKDLPNGKEWYAHQIRKMTDSTLSPEEIHRIGLAEVYRIQQEMFDLADSVGFKGRFDEFVQFMQTDPQFFYANPYEVLEGYQSLTKHIEEKLPLLFFYLPKLPYQVKAVPAYYAEGRTSSYYAHGSAINNRPGTFFINNQRPDLHPKWKMIPLALHEAVPGHHLQIGLAQELENLPEFRKHVRFISYIEGWGLYAEGLGSELGLYQDSYAKFGRLTYEMLRAARLVFDTALNAMGWSRNQAMEYCKHYVGIKDVQIVNEIDRCLVAPAQALAYKIGELKIYELRYRAMEILGEEFDIRAFHHEWLKHGTLPLKMAEKNLNKWIERCSEKKTGSSL